jgi:ABC-type amino acid transport substrate-binding protein
MTSIPSRMCRSQSAIVGPAAIILTVALMLLAAGQSACRKPSGEQGKTESAAAPAGETAAPSQTTAGQTSTPTPDPMQSDDAIAQLLTPWQGDLDGMVERRYIRMLVTFSKTNYFMDGIEQRGATYDAAKLFEEFLNKRLQSKHIRVQIAFIPVSRDRLLPALAEGRGDIAAANLTITPARQQIVNFSLPVAADVRELVVMAPGQPPVHSREDLSGRKIHVRRSSSYFDSLTALNESLRKAGKAPVDIVPANEPLEDEDLLEMPISSRPRLSMITWSASGDRSSIACR